MADMLGMILLTDRAVEMYEKFALESVPRFLQLGILPEEQGMELVDGSFLIYVDLPREKGRVEFVVPRSEWAYKDQN